MAFVVPSPYLVPFDGSFRVDEAPTRPPEAGSAGDAPTMKLTKAVQPDLDDGGKKGKKKDKEKKKGKDKEKGKKKGKDKDKDKEKGKDKQQGKDKEQGKQRDTERAKKQSKRDKERYEEELEDVVEELYDLQRMLYAQDRYAVLLVFQAMDAAGKDSTIRKVMTGINPAGCQVFSFKKPSAEELDHDFLWRTTRRMPERGRIGIFNRSYYEEVLVVRVHPEYLEGQRIPGLDAAHVWQQRYQSIADLERHLALNGTVILKFFLNVSQEEQRDRFIARIDDPRKNWKFSHGDLEERALWPRYMEAYEHALNATSREHAPWYAIPADDKPFMRLTVASIVRDTLRQMPLAYPTLDAQAQAGLAAAREALLEGRA